MIAAELIHVLKKEIKEYENALCSGFCPDYPRYTEMVGKIHGLRLALEIVEDQEKKDMDGG